MNRELYTKYQLRILDGEVPFEDIMASNYTRIIKIAEANGETDVLDRVRPLLAEKKKRFKAKRRAESRQYYADHRDECLKRTKAHYRQFNRLENGLYTARQAAIIKNEIPYEKAFASDFVRIKKAASEAGDFALADLMDNLIAQKRLDAIEDNKRRNRDRYYRMLYDNADDKEEIFTPWEMKALAGEIDYRDISIKQLNKIKRKAYMIGNPEHIEAVKRIAASKTDPAAVYVTTDPVDSDTF